MTSFTAHLRIAATTDVHMHLTGWDALRDTPLAHNGIDRLATLIRDERSRARGGFVLVDNGDALQGTPLGDFCTQMPDDHPWPAILNALDYDAVGLGNHDFDFGLPFLEHVMAQANCAVLCANAVGGAIKGIAPVSLIEPSIPCSDGTDRSLRIGLTSVLPPQTAVWNRRCLDGSVRFEGGVHAVRQSVATLQHAGADLVIVLCHSGMTDGLDPTGENFGAAIAAEVQGIDAMVLGHTHLRFPGPDHAGFDGVDNATGTLHTVPMVMPGHAGHELGVIDLTLDHGPKGWAVATHHVRRRGIGANDAPDASIVHITRPVVEAAQTHLNTPIATTTEHLHTWFSMLRPSRAEDLMARTLSHTVAEAVAGTELESLPLLASVAPAALGGRAGPFNFVDIPPGPVRERHLAMLSPYPNTVWGTVLTGAQVWEWIDRSLAFFAPLGADGADLVNAHAPAFNFDAVHGIEAEIDPFAPTAFDANGHRVAQGATRVRRLTHAGRDVQPQERFVMAMTSYRGAGGGNFPGLGPESRTVRTDVEVREALRNVVMQATSVQPMRNAPPWRFATWGDTRRVVRTSPAAEQYLADIAAFEPRVLGVGKDGFLHIEVSI
ncbi:5'-nucleotidase C-terminal domain-containing protein [uncultured Tateyamaria sp.]|uniref:5'-nucleotidase C-terminal domain-containing protein n=1 Tax=uncultured Tateyamaria sp. TaxID=455651 RepID=UPI00261B7635|nr:5'-nucleotidase C-terminal domain-containing protein [uncultured Tateyamaria sp.]